MDTTEFCENCLREIPSVNYVMHIAHCSRNLEKCSECGEPVHTSLKEEHWKEFHQVVKCELCGEDVIISKLENHRENSCLEKTVECSNCGIDLPFRKLNEHELYCRSRTELCGECHKYVMFKDMENHACLKRRRISGDEGDFATIPCEFCGVQVRLDELENHQSTCSGDPEDVEVTYDSSFTARGGDDIQVIYDSNDSAADNGVEMTDGCHGNTYSSIYALPCEVCNELYPSDKLEQHQLECGVQNDVVDDDDDNHDIEHASDGEVGLPCEFCEELFPGDRLYDHELKCRQRIDIDDNDDDDVEVTHFDNMHRRPRGPRVHQSNDPFNMVMFHPFLFDSIFDSMMANSRRRHMQNFDDFPFNINRAR